MDTLTANPISVKANDTRYGLRAPKGGCTVNGKVYRGGCFCPPYQVDNVHELPTVEIKGASYLVQPIEAGEFGVSAVRLTKRSSHESYDIIRHHDGLVACDCPSYIFTHEGKGTACKHGVACMAHGLLPVAEVAPIATAVDRVFEQVLERAIEAATLASDDESACPVTEDDHRVWEARRSRPARFAPSDEDDAYASGYYLQFHHGLAVEAPSEWRLMRSSAFRLGQAEGLLARHRREDEEREAQLLEQERMEDAYGEPGHDWHPDERIRAVGCVEARLV